MKKTIQYLSATIVACIAFFACSDPYDDQFVAEPTIYEQQPLQDVDFSATILTDPLIITEENIGETFDFIRITPPTLVDSNVTVAYSVLLSDTEDFDPSKPLPVTLSGSVLKASYAEINDTLKALNPTLSEHPAYAKLLAYIVKNGTKALYAAPIMEFTVTTYNFPPVAVNDTLIAIKNEVLIYDVTLNDTDYENDLLTLVSVTQPSHGQATIKGNTIVYTPNPNYTGPDEFTYTITDGNSNATASVIITVTALKRFTEVDVKPYYIIGMADERWNNSVEGLGASIYPLNVVEGYKYNDEGAGEFTFTGYFWASKGFKLIRDVGKWDEQWGVKDGVYVHNDGGSSDIKVPADGYYTITLNSINHTLTIEPAEITPPSYMETGIGLIGGFTGWGSDLEMLPSESSNNHIWYVTYTFDEDTEGKFREIDNWDINWGSELFPIGIGIQDGSNIKIKAGTYVVLFNDISGNYYFFQK
jgi:hypothetical protein